MTESGEHVCTPTVQRDGCPDLYFPNGGANGPDARLIAAAPELLEALEVAHALIDPVMGVCPMGRQEAADLICAAITKAKGETP